MRQHGLGVLSILNPEQHWTDFSSPLVVYEPLDARM